VDSEIVKLGSGPEELVPTVSPTDNPTMTTTAAAMMA
jgi:hypothetical protein